MRILSKARYSLIALWRDFSLIHKPQLVLEERRRGKAPRCIIPPQTGFMKINFDVTMLSLICLPKDVCTS
jgi:hypothetical protein